MGTAREIVAETYDNHDHKHEPMDDRSTDGIRRMLHANKRAIEKLAALIDGEAPEPATVVDRERLEAEELASRVPPHPKKAPRAA